MTYEELKQKIHQWGDDRRLNDARAQLIKGYSELGELSDALLKGDYQEIVDGVGDFMVTQILFCHAMGIDPVECLEYAWLQIANRKGKTVNGTFIKDNDK